MTGIAISHESRCGYGFSPGVMASSATFAASGQSAMMKATVSAAATANQKRSLFDSRRGTSAPAAAAATTGQPFATTDASEIGLWFYPEDQVPAERMAGDCACIFVKGWDPIPAFDNDHEMQQTITIPKEAYIYSMLPHMHFRGKRMRFYAEYPDGSSEELLNIAHYNYNWQLDYELTEPKFVPAGTKIRAIAAFDNSKQNKANPDPARTVPWGQQS